MSLTNPKDVVTEERLSDFYQGILPYLGGMPEMLANKFSKSDLYSADERIIGQWTDGKPLYQKTVQVSVPATNKGATTQVEVDTDSTHKLIKAWGFDSNGLEPASGIDLSGATYTNLYFIYNDTSTQTGCKLHYRVSNIASNVPGFTAYVTIQYTKTTDTAQSIGIDTDYSTTEKIVGTWIDGSPIYQKTINCGALPNNTVKEVAHDISNLDKVINYSGFAMGATMASVGWIPLPLVMTNAVGNQVMLVINSTKIRIGSSTDKSSYTQSYVTIQYTKTAN